MLTAVYKNHLSFGKRLASSLGESDEENPLASSHAFYRDGVQVAGMYNYMSAPSRIELKEAHYLFKRKNKAVFLTQYYTLERDGRVLADAKESLRLFGSKCTISSEMEPSLVGMTLKRGSLNSVRDFLLLDKDGPIGAIVHDRDWGAEIDLPLRVPVALQVFVYRVAFNMWQRGSRAIG